VDIFKTFQHFAVEGREHFPSQDVDVDVVGFDVVVVG
jgi:hypothetical protein